MKIIGYEEIKSLNISPAEFYQWVEEALIHKEEMILPPKISMKPYEGVFCNVMPSIVPNGEKTYGGVKAVTRYPLRKPSLDSKILLYDVESGDYLALLDGNFITAMRTGAVAAHSIMLLSKTDYKTIGVMGLGNVARAAVLMLLSMNPEREFHFKLLKFQGEEVLFSERFSDYPNFHYEFVDNTHDLAKGSDVLISGVTYAPEDFCDDADFDEGVLVVPIHTLGFTNCDLFFDKIFADDYGHVCHFKNFDKFKCFAEVSDVLSGKSAGRENDRERILAYNIGIAVHDIHFAGRIYELCKDLPDVPELQLTAPTEQYWV